MFRGGIKITFMDSLIGRTKEVDEVLSPEISARINLLLQHLSRKTAIHPILITTYGLEYNEYSSDFMHTITLDDLFV